MRLFVADKRGDRAAAADLKEKLKALRPGTKAAERKAKREQPTLPTLFRKK